MCTTVKDQHCSWISDQTLQRPLASLAYFKCFTQLRMAPSQSEFTNEVTLMTAGSEVVQDQAAFTTLPVVFNG